MQLAAKAHNDALLKEIYTGFEEAEYDLSSQVRISVFIISRYR
jgi:hypothetical protein